MVVSIFFRTFAAKLRQKQRNMDKNINVRVMGFPKENYDKAVLDTLKDRELSEWALADGCTIILEDLRDFQDNVLNSPIKECLTSHWWYFLTDLA